MGMMARLTCIGALNEAGFALGRGRFSGGNRGIGLGLFHPVHGHQHAGQLLQGQVTQLRGEGARGVLQTHQPAGVT